MSDQGTATPMTRLEAKPETDRGRAIYESLLDVHAFIRGDLDLIEDLATQAFEGFGSVDLRLQFRALKRDTILWQLRLSCLRHCSFVHLHHTAEDEELFIELRETNPTIGPVIDRLQAEHRRVSYDLDAVEAVANALAEDDGQQARKAVVDSLQALRENLLAHLDYEERSIEATVLRVHEAP